jgi:hypothetical protein
MAKRYLDLVNYVRQGLGKSNLVESSLTNDDADARRSANAVQKAIRDLFTSHTNIPTENFTAEVETVASESKLTNLSTNPWDTKMIREMKYKEENGSEVEYFKIMPITEAQATELLTHTFDNNYPQYYYQKQNDIHVVPVPTSEYKVWMRYSRDIPLIEIENLLDTLDVDNEGYLVLADLVELHLAKRRDPEWQQDLVLARTAAEKYFERINYGLKNQGVHSIMKIEPNQADRNY